MRTITYLSLFLILSFYTKAYGQSTFRDNFIGRYNCLVKYQNPTQTSYENRLLYVSADPAYPNRIILTDSLWAPSQFIKAVNLYSDSTYRDTISSASGGMYYGHFYDLDSIYFHRAVPLGPMGGALMEYWGVKLIPTGLAKLKDEQTVRVFPNPVSQKLLVKPKDGFDITNCRLYTGDGKELVLNEKPKGEYDVSSYPNGIYFLQIKLANAIITKKIIIEH